MSAARILALIASVGCLACGLGLLLGAVEDAETLSDLCHPIGSPNPPTYLHAVRSGWCIVALMLFALAAYLGLSLDALVRRPFNPSRPVLFLVGLGWLAAGLGPLVAGHLMLAKLDEFGGSSTAPRVIDVREYESATAVGVYSSAVLLILVAVGLIVESSGRLAPGTGRIPAQRMKPYHLMTVVTIMAAFVPIYFMRLDVALDLASYLRRAVSDYSLLRPSILVGCVEINAEGLRLTGAVFCALGAIQMLGVIRTSVLLSDRSFADRIAEPAPNSACES